MNDVAELSSRKAHFETSVLRYLRTVRRVLWYVTGGILHGGDARWASRGCHGSFIWHRRGGGRRISGRWGQGGRQRPAEGAAGGSGRASRGAGEGLRRGRCRAIRHRGNAG